MRGMQRPVAAALALLLLTIPVGAHHSILGQFDVSKTLVLTGTIAKVDWINPHAYVHLQVGDGAGSATTWALSTIPLAMMRRAGITRESLAGTAGETVRVIVHPALNGKPLGWVLRITYADGRFYSLFEG
jgi:hypothetical protein